MIKPITILDQVKTNLLSHQYEEAIQLCQQAIEIEEATGEASEFTAQIIWWLGLAYLFNNELEEAESAWLSALISGLYEEYSQWEKELLNFLEEQISFFSRRRFIYWAKIVERAKEKIINSQNEKSVETPLKDIYNNGLIALWENRLKDAAFSFWEAIDQKSDWAEAWFSLAITYHKSQLYDQSLNSIKEAIRLDPENFSYYAYLGLLQQEKGDLKNAQDAYQRSIQLNPSHLEAYFRIANIKVIQNDLSSALAWLESAVQQNKNSGKPYIYLAQFLVQYSDTLTEVGNPLDQALELCQQSLSLVPNDGEALEVLAQISGKKGDLDAERVYFAQSQYYQGNYRKATKIFQEILLSELRLDVSIYKNLISAYLHLKEFSQAEETCKQAIQRYPEDFFFCEKYISILHNSGQTEEALAFCQNCERRFPDSFELTRLKNWLLPIIYSSQQELEFYRRYFSESLEALVNFPILSLEQLDQSIDFIGRKANFFLNYQGQDDQALQKVYANFIHSLLSRKSPQFCRNDLPLGKKTTKVRVGYISDCIYRHTVGVLFLGWLKFANSEAFEIYVYHLNSKFDSHTQQYQLFSQVFRPCASLNIEQIATTILADELDILVFLDVGMTPEMTVLSSMRLAPIQCVAWGHPITTGSPTMDYFLSSELMEPENGQEHYTETLVKLPKISIAYTSHPLPERVKSRADLGLPPEKTLYFSGQSLFKYLPKDDYLFAEILREVPESLLLFISHENPAITERFRCRLAPIFEQYVLELSERCLFLPRLSHIDYLAVNLLSDVGLDSLAWSGGKTTLDAISCCLPLVTYPGAFMRGRHAYGILKALGVEETIASSPEDYCAKAIRLGQDAGYRQEIAEAMFRAHGNLFDDRQAVVALERFYREAVAQKRRG